MERRPRLRAIKQFTAWEQSLSHGGSREAWLGTQEGLFSRLALMSP